MSADLAGAVFRKSQRSGNNGACVEVATNLADVIAVRDSKDLAGPVLLFSQTAWTAFMSAVQGGEFDCWTGAAIVAG